MHYEIASTHQFEKDVRLAKKRGFDITKLTSIVEKLAKGKPLPAKYKDHPLSGEFTGNRECHIQPDWLLVYKKEETIQLIKLVRTGRHADLFDK